MTGAPVIELGYNRRFPSHLFDELWHDDVPDKADAVMQPRTGVAPRSQSRPQD